MRFSTEESVKCNGIAVITPATYSYRQSSGIFLTSTTRTSPDTVTNPQTKNQTSGTSDYSEIQILRLTFPDRSWQRA